MKDYKCLGNPLLNIPSFRNPCPRAPNNFRKQTRFLILFLGLRRTLDRLAVRVDTRALRLFPAIFSKSNIFHEIIIWLMLFFYRAAVGGNIVAAATQLFILLG